MSNIVTVDFRNDTLFAVERDDGVFVAIKPICDTLSIDWKAQKNRIDRSSVLAKGRVMTTLPSVGGPQETVCLRLDLINGWLFGIDAERVKPEARALVITYQEECYAVLFRHFYGRGMEGQPEPLKVAATEDARKESVRTRRQLVSEARQSYGAHAARQLWRYLNLPIVPAMTEPGSEPEFPFTYTAIRREMPTGKKDAA